MGARGAAGSLELARVLGRNAPVSVRRALLRWYRAKRRDLPWRASADPYRVWVCEVMLQQTTVKTALPYYTAFLERFPSVAALASAEVQDVLARWSGLGYYRRARLLHAGARHVVAHHGGRFPETLEAARAVPGVGPYTAAAVLSIAYGVALPVVDGNVRRVLSRMLVLRGSPWTRDAPYYALGAELIDPDAPGDWNQAVMELGATVCTPRAPACPRCPVRQHCGAHAAGLQAQLPEPRERRAPVSVTVAAALIEQRGRVLLVRRDEGRLLGGLWEVPQTGLESRGRRDLVEELRARHGLEVEIGARVHTTRHAITFRRITVEAYAARLLGPPPRSGTRRFAWVAPSDLEELPLSSLTRKLLRGTTGHRGCEPDRT